MTPRDRPFTATRSSIRAAGARCAEILIELIRHPGRAPIHELWDVELTGGPLDLPGPPDRRGTGHLMGPSRCSSPVPIFPRISSSGSPPPPTQIEGHAHGGAGPTHWDSFAATPGNVVRAEDGALACDHYHRWEEDLDLIGALWRRCLPVPRPRGRGVLPEGTGAPNAEGLDFYDRLVDGMLAPRPETRCHALPLGTAAAACRQGAAGATPTCRAGSPISQTRSCRGSATGSGRPRPSTSRGAWHGSAISRGTTPRGCATSAPRRGPCTTS